jgi:threonine dehydrogenase-like Zn-dependent dehydrogenase
VKAVVLRGPGDVGVDEVPDAAIVDDDDAVVAVRATAICGADLFPFHGLTPGFEPGTVLGHEFAGEVVAVGAGVRSVRTGQRVVNTSMISDGTCASCRAGRVTQCEGRSLFGYSGVYPRLDGGQAELVRVPHADRALRPLPDEVSDEAAVFLADILPTGHAAVVRGGVRAGDAVVVVGCGPVGLMAVICAVPVAARVLAVDGVPARRQLAEQLGARCGW